MNEFEKQKDLIERLIKSTDENDADYKMAANITWKGMWISQKNTVALPTSPITTTSSPRMVSALN